MTDRYLEQIGDYVIDGRAPLTSWIVRMAGADEPISQHETKSAAKAAVKRYQAHDKRYAKRG